MTDVVAIGPYGDHDIAVMRRDHVLHEVATPADLADLPEAARNAISAAAFKGFTAFDDAAMAMLPNLGLIAVYGVGYDAVDLSAATARGIRVTNTPDVLNDDVADLAVVMLIGLSRKIVQGDAHVRSGDWGRGRPFPLNRKAGGRRVGIVGLGRIGREIAERLAAFKMEIHYHSRSLKEVPEGWTFHDDPVALARAVDDLVVALVGGPATEGFVSAKVLDALGEDGQVVNISRGTTIDEAALLDRLEQGRLRGAALDVFLNEPKIDPRFFALDNVLLQPHQGSGTVETRRAMAELQRANIAAFLAETALPTPVN